MSNKSLNKGKAGEREFCMTLSSLTGLQLERNLEQTRSGGHDISLASGNSHNEVTRQINKFAIEVKRYARAQPGDISRWWKQAVQQADRVNRLPMLAYRLDRERWQCMVHIGRCRTEDMTGCIRMDISLFAELLKNGHTIFDE